MSTIQQAGGEKGDENAKWVQDMMEVVQTEEYTERFNDIFQGAYILFWDM